ncbi:MAG: serine/threonine-protein phosphatase [Deltaproteobacteria bacterium]|nr:serine/threonine-protein phosphatase [Deltaproteobacteria bacterium]
MRPLRLSAFGGSDIGRRSLNEDRFLVDHFASIYAVADGMGSCEGGEVASGIAVQTLNRFFTQVGTAADGNSEIREARMDMAFRMAHHEVKKRRIGHLKEMGTTLVALRVDSDRRAVISHVGDSRIYRLRGGRLVSLTRDHSLVADMEAAGIPRAQRVMHRHVLTRALGVTEPRQDTQTLSLEPGDRFLLCSDGLTSQVSDRRIASIMSAAPDQMIVPALISEAWRNDACDNTTAVVVLVD